MQFATEAVPAELPGMLRRIIEICGWATWKRRLDGLHSQLRANPLLERYLIETYTIELALSQVRYHVHLTGRCPWPPDTVQQQQLYSFLAMLSRVYQRLTRKGKTRLAGMLRDGLQSPNGLRPLAFEMSAVAHLMSRGYDVQFQDIEMGGRFDFLASKDNAEMEVECKFISGDIGRKIHRRKVYSLCDSLYPVIRDLLSVRAGGQLIRIRLPDRLYGSTDQCSAIVATLREALRERQEITNSEVSTVSITQFNIDNTLLDEDPPGEDFERRLSDYVENNFNIPHCHMFFLIRPTHGAVITTIESEKPDRVVRGIVQQLKDSSRDQLTAGRSGALFVHLGDVTEAQLLDIAEGDQQPSSLKLAANHILERRPHLHTLAFMTSGSVTLREFVSEHEKRVEVQELGSAYVFMNPEHSHANDSRFALFSTRPARSS